MQIPEDEPADKAPTRRSRATDLLREPIEIAKFWRNRRGEAVIVTLREYRGRALIDCRVHYTDREGRLAPTSKGIALLLAKLPDLLNALRKAELAGLPLGLLKSDETA